MYDTIVTARECREESHPYYTRGQCRRSWMTGVLSISQPYVTLRLSPSVVLAIAATELGCEEGYLYSYRSTHSPVSDRVYRGNWYSHLWPSAHATHGDETTKSIKMVREKSGGGCQGSSSNRGTLDFCRYLFNCARHVLLHRCRFGMRVTQGLDLQLEHDRRV